MTNVEQLRDDLWFVRAAVTRRERQGRGPVGIYWVWAAYVAVGYALLDSAPHVAPWFLLLGGMAGGVVSGWVARRYARQTGEVDRARDRRRNLHYGGGIALSMVSAFALAAVIPALRGPGAGQLVVVMIGLVYFLAGIHFDANMLWLGPVLIAGGVLVGLVPRYGWTGLGIVIALGLVVPTLLPARRRGDAGGGPILSEGGCV
jgi:hypothetical protein